MSNNTHASTTGKQDYGTPQCFVDMVGDVLQGSVFGFDLAASEVNTKAVDYYDIDDDSFGKDWASLSEGFDYLWLNPEYRHNPQWFKKCWEEAQKGAKIAVLSIDNHHAKWYRDYCIGKCLIMEMDGRLIFEGEENGYPKDLAVFVYGSSTIGNVFWDWKKDLESIGYKWNSKLKKYAKMGSPF